MKKTCIANITYIFLAMLLTSSSVSAEQVRAGQSFSSQTSPSQWTLAWELDPAKSRKITAAEQTILLKSGCTEKTISELRMPEGIEIARFDIDCSIKQADDASGWVFKTGKGTVRLRKSRDVPMNAVNSKVQLSIKNLSKTHDAEIAVYNHDIGLNILDTIIIKKQIIHPDEEVVVETDLSLFDGFTMCMPPIEIQGEILLKKYQIYTCAVPGVVCVEGTVMERSNLPEPGKLNYPDCRFTARFEGFRLRGGDHVCKKELQLTIDGYKKSRKMHTDNLKPGDKIRCNIIPVDRLPEKATVIQVADDLSLFDLDNYFCLSCTKINTFSGEQSDFADGLKEYTSIFDRHINQPISEELKEKQSRQIKADLEKLNKLLTGYPENITELNNKFQSVWQKEKERDKGKGDGYNRVKVGNRVFVWRNIDNSFWALQENFTFINRYSRITDNNMRALLALKKCCEANGVQLIISLVPDYQDIAARVINKELRSVPDYQTAIVARQLSEAGIETIYASDALIENYNRYTFAYFYPADHHPAHTAQDILTDEMAQRLERYNFPKVISADHLSFVEKDFIDLNGIKYIFPTQCDIGGYEAKKGLLCREIHYNGRMISEDKHSAIIIVGNSFLVTPYYYSAYVAMLVNKIRYRCDFGSFGGESLFFTFFERLFADPEFYLKGKKVCILQAGPENIINPSSFSNIENMDDYAKLMIGKNLIYNVVLHGQKVHYQNCKGLDLTNWLTLTDKNEFITQKDQPVEVSVIDSTHFDRKKPVVCVVTACNPALSKKVYIACNKQKRTLSNSGKFIRYEKITFELPAGTKEVNLSLSGDADSLVSIQKILIYQ